MGRIRKGRNLSENIFLIPWLENHFCELTRERRLGLTRGGEENRGRGVINLAKLGLGGGKKWEKTGGPSSPGQSSGTPFSSWGGC